MRQSTSKPTRRQCRYRRRTDFARFGRLRAFAQGAATDQNRLRHGADRPARRQRQAGAARRQIWQEEVNAKGGLLGRQVQLVNYDDQSNPSTVPGIYTKLLDVDKVDLVVSGYATNMVAPAIPVVMQKDKTFISLFALAANSEFHYPKYFSMLPSGGRTRRSPSPKAFSRSRRRKIRSRKPSRIAAEDAEFSRNAADGARNNVKTVRLQDRL